MLRRPPIRNSCGGRSGDSVGDLLVRDVERPVADCWKERSRLARRSVHGEVETLLAQECERSRQQADFWRWADEFREAQRGRVQSDSADLIREDRDSNYGHPER